MSLIREIERLKISRLTSRHGAASIIREQDLNLAILRASLGTTAQHDPYLSRLQFSLPGGPVRPLLPSLTNDDPPHIAASTDKLTYQFDTLLLGSTLSLSYILAWPLDLFLGKADLSIYSTIFSFLSALRKTHTRVHTCWTSLSNAQRARRRWTGYGEGGTAEEVDVRAKMLRCGWGIVRDMSWFLDTLLGYVMMDVVDVEFRKLKEILGKHREGLQASKLTALKPGTNPLSSSHLDFTTLRIIHTNYLGRLVDGCLLNNNLLSSLMRQILDVCERFVAVVERWGGDVLPALLFEGSIVSGEQEVGAIVKERWAFISEMDEVCTLSRKCRRCVVNFFRQVFRTLLESFYEHLTQSMSQPFSAALDVSKSGFLGGVSMFNQTTHNISRTTRGIEGDLEQNRRHLERLLLRLDFNGELSKPRKRRVKDDTDILGEGGL